jgi:TRAP-type uncharacterized transport system substrate-binding protein
MNEKPQLIITFDPQTNQVAVNGPIKNRFLSYAMLKLAEKAIDEFSEREKAKAGEIVPIHANGDDVLRALGRR